ncbi:hypothetical protein L6164_004474 [Bauhinia variegata]|uniref:Uncharacterized protein n=1 Tax=Bauhinia variegata TaxID=167791 RepID=A0ACB9Q6Q8_BAUVA|nr:hypothetical protein L6164_004474 [Bauhinia variegata]
MRRNYHSPAPSRQVHTTREDKRNPASASLEAERKEAAASTTAKLERKPTEDIDASADAFIKNFRQQLLIQRLQSIENYEKMLARGL